MPVRAMAPVFVVAEKVIEPDPVPFVAPTSVINAFWLAPVQVQELDAAENEIVPVVAALEILVPVEESTNVQPTMVVRKFATVNAELLIVCALCAALGWPTATPVATP